MNKIAIIGSGSFGTAIANMLADRYPTYLYGRNETKLLKIKEDRENKEYLEGITLKESINYTSNLKEAIEGAEIIILALPSKAVRSTILNIKDYYLKGQKIISLTKGIEEETLKRYSEVIEEIIPEAEVFVMSGPTHAEEVGRNLPTAIVVAGKNHKDAEEIQSIFMSDTFRVYTSDDVVGVETGGAVKNIIALVAGISDGLGFEDNTKAALMTRGLTEMTRLGLKLGADLETFLGLSGIGDLIVTCTSMHSRNRRCGILLGKGYKLDEALKEIHMVVEGVNSVKAVKALADKYDVSMPIVSEAYAILFEDKNAKEAALSLMTRDKTKENNI